MSWYLHHCFVGAPCNQGTPLIAARPTLMPRTFQRWASGRSRRSCNQDLRLGIGVSLQNQMDDLLVSRGFESVATSGGSPWLWCLGGPEVYRQPLTEEDQRWSTMINAGASSKSSMPSSFETTSISIASPGSANAASSDAAPSILSAT